MVGKSGKQDAKDDRQRAPKARGQSWDKLSGRSRRQPGKAVPHSVKGVAFYDLDGTLVELNLVHATLFLLANLGEWSGRLKYLLGFAARLPRLYMAEQSDRRGALAKAAQRLAVFDP